MQHSIRPWTEADASVIAEALNDAGVTDNLRDGLPTPYTEADARDYIAFAQTAGEGPTPSPSLRTVSPWAASS